MKKPDDLLGTDNYFHWEFNMKMTLARKGLLEHILEVKLEQEMTEDWKVKDMKAFAIIAQGIEVKHQTKIRHARTAKEAWETLRDYYNKTNLQNRVALTRRLHEFRMDEGGDMVSHLDRFDELVLSMEAVGDTMDDARQMTVLLSSLPAEYEMIVSIIENSMGVTMVDVKEKLLKEHKKKQQQEVSEGAFRVGRGGHKQDRGRGMRKQRGAEESWKKKQPFRGKCHRCNKIGHKQFECRSATKNDGNEMAFTATNGLKKGWLLDSGASSHMTPAEEDFFEYEKLREAIQVRVADGAVMNAIGRGSIRFRCTNGTAVTVNEVLHIPTLDRRLLAVPKIVQRGYNVRFGEKYCGIYKDNVLMISAKRMRSVYTLDVEYEHAMLVEHEDAGNKWELWHARMGHISHNKFKKTKEATEGLPNVVPDTNKNLCGGCLQGKLCVASFPQESKTKTTQPLQLIHSDVMGPMKNPTPGGSRYVLSLVDDFSRLVTVYFLKSKSEVLSKFIEFRTEMEQQCGSRIKAIRTDNGGEYKNKRFASYCKKHGIIHQKTVPYSPQQNGVAERMNRTIVETARSMMHYKRVAKKWWAEAVNTAVYLLNRTTNCNHEEKTPFELCFKTKPEISHLRVFGSLGYAHIDDSKRTKFDAKGFRCMLLGYARHTKGYRVLDLETGTIKISRSIALDEREVSNIYEDNPVVPHPKMIIIRQDDDDGDQPSNLHQDGDEDVEMEEHEIVEDVEMEVPSSDNDISNTPSSETSNHYLARNMNNEQHQHTSQVIQQGPRHQELELHNPHDSGAMVFRPQLKRRSGREHQYRVLTDDASGRSESGPRGGVDEMLPIEQPVQLLLEDNNTSTTTENSIVPYNENHEASGSEDDEPPSKRSRINSDVALIAEVAMIARDLPGSYAEAVNGPDRYQWIKAIENEFAAHERNKTWTPIVRKPGMKPIGSKWVWAKKSDGRYKARLVALGFLQQYGINFFETYAAVASMNSIRMLLSICCAAGYVIDQLDVDTAYLNADLQEEVYLLPPKGMKIGSEFVLKLNRALYGLKQAANAWNKTIHNALLEMGFVACGADRCIYKIKDGEGWAYVCLYVDDMIVAAKEATTVRKVKEQISQRFQTKDLGPVKHLLGMEVMYDRKKREMFISQQRYIEETADMFGQTQARPTGNPCDQSMKLSSANSPKSDVERQAMSRTPYRQLLGRLLFIVTTTRPDAAFPVSQLGRFAENPGSQHWKALIKVLRYLRSTSGFGLHYSVDKLQQQLTAYSDADWGNSLDDRRSVSGVLLVLNGGPVIFKSKYQRTVALSTSEAEYMALSMCTQDILWARMLMADLGFEQKNPTVIYEDNQGAIALATNPGYHARTKHVDIRHHFVREKVLAGDIKVIYKETEHQLADILTKALGTKRFQYLRAGMDIKVRDGPEHQQ